jgi:hypothetical protein
MSQNNKGKENGHHSESLSQSRMKSVPRPAVTMATTDTADPRVWTFAARRSWGPALRMVLVRLRFPAILVLGFLLVGKWDVLRNYWDTFTRPARPDDSASRAVSNDTEYFCPMDPGVVSDWPSKCGICNMALVRRKRGAAVALPDGIVARMQLSPYRVQLAGIRTAPAGYLPLKREAESAGIVQRASGAGPILVRTTFSSRDGRLVHEGAAVDVACAEIPAHPEFHGVVCKVTHALGEDDEVTVEVEDGRSKLRDGMVVTIRIRQPISEIEPFQSLPSDLPALKPAEQRLVYTCADHPESLREAAGRCPVDRNELEQTVLADNQRLRWWCPMHPDVTAERGGGRCEACGGMRLRPRVVTYRPPGEVLAVPESAVVDTGKSQVVFVERMPGIFDGVAVTLGPRCGDFYPVVQGLEQGQRVAVAGAFLLDAETRLNPSLVASYFGAGRASKEGPAIAPPRAESERAPASADLFHDLSTEDRAAAVQQRICPVTRKPLGSMGTPVKVTAAGRIIFLCCEGCEEKLRQEPARYLGTAAKVADPAAKSRP